MYAQYLLAKLRAMPLWDGISWIHLVQAQMILSKEGLTPVYRYVSHGLECFMVQISNDVRIYRTH